jgi:hypothetical protein
MGLNVDMVFPKAQKMVFEEENSRHLADLCP